MEAGTQAQALISDSFTLDFSGLFSADPEKKAPSTSSVEPHLEDKQYKNTSEPESPVKRLKTGLEGIPPEAPAKRLILEQKEAQRERERTAEVYRTYQDNIRKSGQLQTDILKGLKAGEDIYSLFLKAVDAIGCMTSNRVFRSQIEEDLKSIYGRGLREPAPLKLELEQTRERLKRLLEAQEREPDQDSQRRIGAAITAHKNRIAELEQLTGKTQL